MKKIIALILILMILPGLLWAADTSKVVLDKATYISGKVSNQDYNFGASTTLYAGDSYGVYKFYFNGAIIDSLRAIIGRGNAIDSIRFYATTATQTYFDTVGVDDQMKSCFWSNLQSGAQEGVGSAAEACGMDWTKYADTTGLGGCGFGEGSWNTAGALGAGTDRSTNPISDTTQFNAPLAVDSLIRLGTVSWSLVGTDSLKWGVFYTYTWIVGDAQPRLAIRSDDYGTVGARPYCVIFYHAGFSHSLSVVDTTTSSFKARNNWAGEVGMVDTIWLITDTDTDTTGGVRIEETTGITQTEDTIQAEDKNENTKYYFWFMVADDNGRHLSAIDSITTEYNNLTMTFSVIDTTNVTAKIEMTATQVDSALKKLVLIWDDFNPPTTHRDSITASVTNPDTLDIAGLTPATKYYVTIIGTDSTQSKTSDVDSFTTDATSGDPGADVIAQAVWDKWIAMSAVFEGLADSLLKMRDTLNANRAQIKQLMDSISYLKDIFDSSLALGNAILAYLKDSLNIVDSGMLLGLVAKVFYDSLGGSMIAVRIDSIWYYMPLNTFWTQARAILLDSLDAKISSRLKPGDSTYAKGGITDTTRNVKNAVTPTDTTESGTALTGGMVSLPDSLWHRLDSLQHYILEHGAGTGAYACTLFVFNADTVAVQGVYVRAMNNAQTTTEARAWTNANGRVVFSLDALKYKLWLYKAGVTASNPDSVTVVVAGITDTIWATEFSPTAPSDTNLCLLYGYVEKFAGVADSGAIVEIQMTSSGVRRISDSVIITPFAVKDTTDGSGYFSLSAIPNARLAPSGTTYQISIYHTGGQMILRPKIVTVPNQATWRFVW